MPYLPLFALIFCPCKFESFSIVMNILFSQKVTISAAMPHVKIILSCRKAAISSPADGQPHRLGFLFSQKLAHRVA